MFSLPVLQYPRTQNAVVTVATTYAGADADIIAGFITTPLESAIAQASGIDYMTSTSQTGLSTITVNLRLNYDSGKALTEINTKVNSVINQLPSGAQQPVLTVKVGQTIDSMYIGFSSDAVAANQITDYLTRVVQPGCKLSVACRPPNLLVAVLALRVGSIRRSSPPTADRRRRCSAALAEQRLLAGLGTPKARWSSSTFRPRQGCIAGGSAPDRRASGQFQYQIGGCRHRLARVRGLPFHREIQWEKGGLYRHPSCAERQSARRRQGREEIYPISGPNRPRE